MATTAKELRAATSGLDSCLPSRMWRSTFSTIHDRVVDDEADRQHDREDRQEVREKPIRA